MAHYSMEDITPFQNNDSNLDECVQTSTLLPLHELVIPSAPHEAAIHKSQENIATLPSSGLPVTNAPALLEHIPTIVAPLENISSLGRISTSRSGRPLRGLGIYLGDNPASTDESGVLSAFTVNAQDMGLFDSPMDIDNTGVQSSPIRLPNFYDILETQDNDQESLSANAGTVEVRQSEPLSQWFSDDGFYCMPPIPAAFRSPYSSHPLLQYRSVPNGMVPADTDSQPVMSPPFGRSPIISGLYADINMFASLTNNDNDFVRPEDLWMQDTSPVARSSCLTSLFTKDCLSPADDPEPQFETALSPTPKVCKRTRSVMEYEASPLFLPSGDEEEHGNLCPSSILSTTNLACSGIPVYTRDSWIQILGSSSENECPSTSVSTDSATARTFCPTKPDKEAFVSTAFDGLGIERHARAPLSSLNGSSEHHERKAVRSGREELIENLTTCTTTPFQVATPYSGGDHTFISETLYDNEHRGILVEAVIRRVSSFRKECPGEKLPDHLLFEFAGKSSITGQPIDGYRCYIMGCYKTTKRKDHMADHIRMHVGEKPYQCKTW